MKDKHDDYEVTARNYILRLGELPSALDWRDVN